MTLPRRRPERGARNTGRRPEERQDDDRRGTSSQNRDTPRRNMSRSPVRSERTDSYRGRDDSRGWGGDSTTRRDNTPPLRRDSQRSCTWNSPSNRSDGGSWDGYSTPTRRTGGGQRQNAYDSPSNRSSRYGTPNSTENVWRGAPALKPKPKPASPEWKGAPAFKPKKKTEDDEHRFQYLRSDYATEETADSTEGKIFAPWQQADTIGAPVNMDMENPELDVANGVREKFVRPEDLLKGDLYKTAMKSGKYVIHSQIGDHMVVTGEQKVDQRALLLNRDGTGYTDGKDHGQIKKRYIEEWQKRLVDRDGELKVACRIQQRWDNMSQEEKDRCYAIRAESKRILDPLVRAEISYGIPEEYMGRQASVRPPRRRPIDHTKSIEGTRSQQDNSISPIDTTGSVSDPESVELFVGDDQPAAVPITAASAEAGSSVATADASEIVEPRDPNTIYKVEEHPEVIPFVDLAPRTQHVGGDPEKVEKIIGTYDAITSRSSEKGRIVAVQLSSGLIDFTRQALTERVFGGTIQEMQFIAEKRLVIVGFLDPLEAEAFIMHVTKCRQRSTHEYRRLQIAAEWYRGSEAESVFPYQHFTLFSAVIEGMTRVLKITHIHKQIKQMTLLMVLQSQLVDHDIVKLVLVVPQKRYERDASEYSNEAILEFSSMKNASEVKELFDNGKLNDFKGSKAIYVPDPCTRIPTTFPWCDCSACSNDTSAMTIHMRGEGKKERAESPKKYRSEKSALKNKAPGAMKPSDY